MTRNRLRKLLDFPLDEAYREPVQRSLAVQLCRPQRVMCLMILLFQAAMMVMMALKSGGPFAKPRRTGYFCLYAALFAVSAAAGLLALAYRRRVAQRHRLYLNCVAAYAAFFTLWGCGITLLDQLGGNSLAVYTYVILTLAVFTALRPWQAALLFGGSCALLNALLAAFRLGGGNNLFSNLVNSVSVAILAVAVSVMLYRYRVFSCHDAMIIQRQFEEIRKINEELHLQVQQDQLTRMHNRRYFEETVRGRIRECWAQGGTAAGMMVDIDHFKAYNDRHGHQQGDACLRMVAETIMEFARREGGCAVRYGGEEFFVCLFGCGEQAAEAAAWRLCRLVRERRLSRGDGLGEYVTVSVGLCAGGEMDLNEFMERTDQALYRAKAAGRDRVSR